MPATINRLHEQTHPDNSLPKHVAETYSPNVFINDFEVVRRTDVYKEDPHGHKGKLLVTQVTNVFVNDLEIATKGDELTENGCLTKFDESSPNVFAGG